MTTGTLPEIAVVVPSHDRPLRLRWLLNGLEDQMLERDRFEVIVCHDSSGPETGELLETHPLASSGTLRQVALPPHTGTAAAHRNAAWRAARAPLLAFTDDDCRPPPEWLEHALAAARRHPGAVVQGRTAPDPHEAGLLGAPHARTQEVDPPTPLAHTCNIVYPRDLLERLGGFEETMRVGEDTDLALRARQAGAAYVGAPEVLTWHAVDAPTLLGRLRSLPRWRDMPALVRRHPEHRNDYPLRVFWKSTHGWLPVAAAGAVLARRNPAFLLLGLPWAYATAPRYRSDVRSRVRQVVELPGRAAIDLTEFAFLCWGSLKHRTLFL
jgi:glycosyltransferase involved in cell wall biosynthesis